MPFFLRFMSELFALGSKVMCNTIAGLVSVQRTLCRQNPDVMISIGKGAKLGVEECQYQFKDQRWNCSTVKRDASVFGKVMRKGNKTCRVNSCARQASFALLIVYDFSLLIIFCIIRRHHIALLIAPLVGQIGYMFSFSS